MRARGGGGHARPRPSARPGPQARVDAGHRAPGPGARSRPDAHAARPGTLERALQRGLLHTRRSRRPRLLLVVVLALDIARALAYLHTPNGLVRPRPRTPAEHAQACSAGRRREGPGPPLASLPRAGRPERRAPQRGRVAAHALQQGARPAPPRAGEPASGGDCVRRPRPAAHAGRGRGRRPAAPERAAEAAAQVHGDIASSNVLLTRRGAFGALGAGRLRAKARAPQHAAPCGQRFSLPAGRLRRPRRGARAPRVSRMQPHACGVAACLRARPGRPPACGRAQPCVLLRRGALARPGRLRRRPQGPAQQAGARGLLRAHAPAARPRSQVANFGCAQRAVATRTIVEPGRRGALAYQAPEVLERGVLTPAADCYAFGVLLWEMLAAQARPDGRGACLGSPHAPLWRGRPAPGARPQRRRCCSAPEGRRFKVGCCARAGRCGTRRPAAAVR